MDLIFVFRIPLLLLVLVLLVFALPAGLIAGTILLVFLIWRWLVRKSRLELERRDAAIMVAVDELPRAERFDWYNKEGRYAPAGSIPRTLPLRFMREDERGRYDNKTGEFVADERC
jgi:hypothetical protein